MIVVIDTNLWVSALQFGGIPRFAIAKALETDQVAVSDFIEEEIARILTHKFNRDVVGFREVLDEFLSFTLRVQIRSALPTLCRDPSDNAILETAISAGADYLISGDKDLLSLKTFGSCKIITAREYLTLREQ